MPCTEQRTCGLGVNKDEGDSGDIEKDIHWELSNKVLEIQSGGPETDQGWSSGGSLTNPRPWSKACNRRRTLRDKEGGLNEAIASGSPRPGSGTRGPQGTEFKEPLTLHCQSHTCTASKYLFRCGLALVPPLTPGS